MKIDDVFTAILSAGIVSSLGWHVWATRTIFNLDKVVGINENEDSTVKDLVKSCIESIDKLTDQINAITVALAENGILVKK